MKILCRLVMVLYAAIALCGCSEETLALYNGKEGEEVSVQLSYKQLTTKEIVVMRATAAENALNNLQIFIFDKEGNLKGYKYLEQAALKQDGTVGTVSVKTITGQVRIYAVANATTAIYKMATSKTSIPTSGNEWSETDAQQGLIKFTLDDLKAIAFNRVTGEKDISEANFMMSGAANKGDFCTIIKDRNGAASISSPTSDDDQLIKLRRIVAKVTFNVKTGSLDGKTIEFTPTTYEFHNVPIEGSLIEGAGIVPSNYENFVNGSYSAQTPGVFEAYLPENLQAAQTGAKISAWDDREADTGEGNAKTFTAAPQNGTYVVLRGTYTEKTDGVLTRDATVAYYIHLGDFGTNLGDFNVNRNYHYTYNVTVNGVNNICVQVTTKNDGVQPGAEGIVFDYGTGTSYMLDSHYEYCVMQFNRDEIKALKDEGFGYTFKVKALDNTGTLRESENIVVRSSSELDDEQKQELNGVDLDWARFLKGGKYNKSASHGGADTGYKTLREANGYTDNTKTDVGYNVVELLAYLYNLDYNSTEWDSDGNITFTCYVAENYYNTFSWGKYANIDPRILYVANTIDVSNDKRSVYAKVKYAMQQYSIQTFYNTANDGSIIAYGLETIRDDHKNGADNPGSVTTVVGTDHWNGLENMKKDIDESNSARDWDKVNYDQIKLACMSRNRDLNGNGHIDDNELRWYMPAVEQYVGMWIGENALNDTKTRCYNGVTTELSEPNGEWLNRTGAEHYFSNTAGFRVIWAEEGAATGNDGSDKKLKYVRCIRNMKSNDLGINSTPDKYYVVSGRTIDLSRIANSALRTSIQENELAAHTERGVSKNVANAARKFTYAQYNTLGKPTRYDSSSDVYPTGGNGWTTMRAATTNNLTLCSQYREGTVLKGWRAPNQRELCMMFILDAFQVKSEEGCRTSFTGSQLRYSWYINGTPDVTMGSNNPDTPISLRCVRDTE